MAKYEVGRKGRIGRLYKVRNSEGPWRFEVSRGEVRVDFSIRLDIPPKPAKPQSLMIEGGGTSEPPASQLILTDDSCWMQFNIIFHPSVPMQAQIVGDSWMHKSGQIISGKQVRLITVVKDATLRFNLFFSEHLSSLKQSDCLEKEKRGEISPRSASQPVKDRQREKQLMPNPSTVKSRIIHYLCQVSNLSIF